MARYMIQSTHNPSHDDCVRFRESLMRAGAHFLNRAEWGCDDGNHVAWLILEAENDHDAWLAVPPALRQSATVTRLNRFGLSDLFGNVGAALAGVAA